ncbi:MAG TPA: hypothetical protein VM889_06265 [Candidatus Thermoplasmatota archaeon]|nr:hypothetical protein [Candidatus Thermoplasmatota archaeon]
MRLLLISMTFASVMLALPMASAQSDIYVPETEGRTLEPGVHLFYELDDASGVTRYDFLIQASGPIDIFLLSQIQYEAYQGASSRYFPTESFLQKTSLRHIFRVPANQPYVLVIDNSASPSGGAPGSGYVTVRSGYIPLTPDGTAGGLDDFLRTLFLRQDYWEVPLVTGVAVAGPTLIFFFIALASTGIAHVDEEEQGHWWLSLIVLTIVGAAFTIVVPGVGFLLDARWLTIPAAIYGYLTYKRTANTMVSVAAVFSVTYFASLVGVDVLTEIMHHTEHVEDYYYTGSIGVFGGAGWGDLLIIAPVIAVATFLFWGRLGTSHTKLPVESSLQGDTHDGTLFLKIVNRGEQAARNVQISATFHGHGLPDTAIEEGLLVEELPPGHEVTHSMDQPGRVVGLDAAWGAIRVIAWAENARAVGDTIELTD